MGEILLTAGIGLLMFFGLVGVVIPVLPDLALIWIAGLGYGLAAGWGERGPWLFAAISLFGAVGLFSEVILAGTGARRAGSSFLGIMAGFTLGVVGLLAAGPLGGVAGLLAGVFLVEYMRVKDAELALKATLGMGVGLGASLVVKLVLGALMIAAWLLWVFWK